MSIKIVTDSTADLDKKWVDQYDIGVIPVFINFGETSYADDGVDITRPEFYRRLIESKELPTTAAPPIGLNDEAFRQKLQSADHLVALSVARQFK